jgi:hypothetical protein
MITNWLAFFSITRPVTNPTPTCDCCIIGRQSDRNLPPTTRPKLWAKQIKITIANHLSSEKKVSHHPRPKHLQNPNLILRPYLQPQSFVTSQPTPTYKQHPQPQSFGYTYISHHFYDDKNGNLTHTCRLAGIVVQQPGLRPSS